MVKMEHIHKQFSGVTVLDDVSLEVRPGEVHALAGGNGAGKSTLMKILQGIYQRDGGSIDIAGKSYESLNVDSARKAGVGMVFQEFSLVPTMNIAQNIFMGAEKLGTGHFLDKKDMRDRAVELLGRLGVDLDPDTEVGELATGYWQLTEIAKALRADARVLILDEPTASLSAAEIESFFALVRNLKRQGISLIYISHRMDEIRKIADRITILRNGRNLLTRDIGDITDEEIIEGIVGKPTETLARRERNGDALGQVLLDVHDLKSDKGLNGVTLQVRRGEVVGLAGLMGSGRTEVTRALFGIDRITSGEISMSGKPYHPKNPQDAMAASVALVPEDRREQGLIVSHSVAENLAITRLDECRSMGLLAGRKIAALADGLIKQFSVKVDSPRAPASRLSGGNQQKVVIAKWLGRDPDLLVMDEPTAGVDIGTKSEVLSRVTQFADSGKAVLFISSELAEMVAVCDRYIVMKHGSSVGELDGASIRDESELQLAIQHAGKTTNTAEQGNVIQEGKE
jgi:ribose transport system ATP-binding protein